MNKAFSLIELLVVVAIMSVLVVIATPMVGSLVESNNLSRGGQELADQVNLARQTSASRNRAVELRLFKVPERAATGYSGLQLWMANDAGNAVPLNRAVLLPQSIVVAESATLSKGLGGMSAGKMPSDAGAGASQNYVALQVRPGGMVMPVQNMRDSFLTVVISRFAASSELPDNYVTIQVNPLTATPLIYRP